MTAQPETLLVAVHAMDLLGLPRAHVVGVTMPGFGTSKGTYENACALVRSLGATLREFDIKEIAGQVFAAIGHDPMVKDATFENVHQVRTVHAYQARPVAEGIAYEGLVTKAIKGDE